MYKKASQNQQHSERLKADTKFNTAGVDDTAFEQDMQRTRLIERKRETEHAIKQIGDSISHAQRVFGQTGQRTSRSVYEKMLADKAAKMSELQDTERQLAELKRKRRLRYRDSRDSLPEIFMRMAKNMLAEPVYERILIAAVHALHSNKDAG